MPRKAQQIKQVRSRYLNFADIIETKGINVSAAVLVGAEKAFTNRMRAASRELGTLLGSDDRQLAKTKQELLRDMHWNFALLLSSKLLRQQPSTVLKFKIRISILESIFNHYQKAVELYKGTDSEALCAAAAAEAAENLADVILNYTEQYLCNPGQGQLPEIIRERLNQAKGFYDVALDCYSNAIRLEGDTNAYFSNLLDINTHRLKINALFLTDALVRQSALDVHRFFKVFVDFSIQYKSTQLTLEIIEFVLENSQRVYLAMDSRKAGEIHQTFSKLRDAHPDYVPAESEHSAEPQEDADITDSSEEYSTVDLGSVDSERSDASNSDSEEDDEEKGDEKSYDADAKLPPRKRSRYKEPSATATDLPQSATLRAQSEVASSASSVEAAIAASVSSSSTSTSKKATAAMPSFRAPQSEPSTSVRRKRLLYTDPRQQPRTHPRSQAYSTYHRLQPRLQPIPATPPAYAMPSVGAPYPTPYPIPAQAYSSASGSQQHWSTPAPATPTAAPLFNYPSTPPSYAPPSYAPPTAADTTYPPSSSPSAPSYDPQSLATVLAEVRRVQTPTQAHSAANPSTGGAHNTQQRPSYRRPRYYGGQ